MLLAAVFFLAYAGVFCFRAAPEQGIWHKTYVTAAQRLMAQTSLHVATGDDAYAYPSAMALLAIPLALLSPQWSLIAWYLVNVAAICVAVTCGWRLAGGPSWIAVSRVWRWVLLVTIALAGKHLISPLENQQTDIVIAACLFSGLYLIAERRPAAGGALVGLGAAMKCTPLLFIPYLLWRKQWLAAAAAAGVAVGVNLAPDWIYPQTNGLSYLGDWKTVYLTGVAQNAPGEWAEDQPSQTRLSANQSLAGFFHRAVIYGFPTSYPQLEKLPLHSGGQAVGKIRLFVYGSALLLAGVTAWWIGWPGNPAKLPTGVGGRGSWRMACECSAVLSLMVLVSPMSSKAHYVVLILPCFILTRLWLTQRPAWSWVILLALLISGPGTIKGIVGKPLGELFMFWGLPTLFPLATLVGIWLALHEDGGKKQ